MLQPFRTCPQIQRIATNIVVVSWSIMKNTELLPQSLWITVQRSAHKFSSSALKYRQGFSAFALSVLYIFVH